LLGDDPPSVIEPLAAAVTNCAAYRAVRDQLIFSAGYVDFLVPHDLAVSLFRGGVRWGSDIPGAIDWLLRFLNARVAEGIFNSAIWGLRLDQEMVALSKTSRLMAFAALPDSHMKKWILDRAKPIRDGTVWTSQKLYGAPLAALVEEVPNFPRI